MTVRLVTFNVRNGRAVGDGWNCWWLRRSAVVATVAPLDADVLALQEVYRFQLLYLLRSLAQFDGAGVGRNDGQRRGEHAPILVRRRRFEIERTETRWLSDTPQLPGSRSWGNRSPRIATLAWLRQRAGGARLGVVNAHLDAHSPDARLRGAEAIAGWVAAEPDRPWVVLGDFNDPPDGPALAALAAGGHRDALAHLPAGGAEGSTAHGWRGEGHGPRLDHVLVPATTPVRAAVVRHRPWGRLASDHWPVVADVGLG